MSKPAAIFVAAAMAVTAGCVAVIASYGLALGLGPSIAAGFAALAGMAVLHFAFMRAVPREDPRVDELDRLATDLQSRLETIEARLSTIESASGEKARIATKPLVEEIAALGGLVTTVAKEVAAHDVALAKLKGQAVDRTVERRPPPAEPAHAPPPPTPPIVAQGPLRPPKPAPPPAAAPAKIQAPEPFDPAALDEPSESHGAAADPELAFRVQRALSEDRIEPHLQPIVSLPSRRTVHYEAFSRLVEADGVLAAEQFMDAAVSDGRAPQIDRRIVERSAAVALRIAARGDGSLFVNLARETLRDASAIEAIEATLDAQPELRRLIVPEVPQSVFETLSPEDRAVIEAFVERGCRLSIDKVEDLKLDPRSLARRGVRFVKIPAVRLLDPDAAQGLAIHPADLSSLLARHGVELVATHVEEERTVPELLDMEVRFAQGLLFGVPRPVRPAAPDQEKTTAPGPRLVPRSAGAAGR